MMLRTKAPAFGVTITLLMLAAVPPGTARQLKGTPLVYQDRGNRHEGVILGPDRADEDDEDDDYDYPGARVSLLSLTAYDKDKREDGPLSALIQLGFYLPSVNVELRVRSLIPPPNYTEKHAKYLMNKVIPGEPWKRGAYNYFAWPTAEVILPLGYKESSDLGFVAELPSMRSRRTPNAIDVAPITLYQSEFPDRVNAYSFVFRVSRTRPVEFSLYKINNPGSMIPQGVSSSRRRPITRWRGGYYRDGLARLSWRAQAARSGWYYIEAAEAGMGNRGIYGVSFYHRQITLPERYYARQLQTFKDAIGETIEEVQSRRRALRPVELSQVGELRPASYLVAAGPAQRRQRLLAYEADAVREILRAGRSYLDKLTDYMFSGIRAYVNSEYPSEEELQTIPDPRNPQRQLVLKPAADKILDRALAVLREVNSLPSLYVIVEVTSQPEGAEASLTTFDGRIAGAAVTPGKIFYLPRGKYMFEMTMKGFQEFKREFNFMRSRVYTTVGCNLYAEGAQRKSRCNNPE